MPLFREAFRVYGLPVGEGDPTAAVRRTPPAAGGGGQVADSAAVGRGVAAPGDVSRLPGQGARTRLTARAGGSRTGRGRNA